MLWGYSKPTIFLARGITTKQGLQNQTIFIEYKEEIVVIKSAHKQNVKQGHHVPSQTQVLAHKSLYNKTSITGTSTKCLKFVIHLFIYIYFFFNGKFLWITAFDFLIRNLLHLNTYSPFMIPSGSFPWL